MAEPPSLTAPGPDQDSSRPHSRQISSVSTSDDSPDDEVEDENGEDATEVPEPGAQGTAIAPMTMHFKPSAAIRLHWFRSYTGQWWCTCYPA